MNKKTKLTINNILYWGLPILAIITVIIAWISFSSVHPELMPDPVQVWDRMIRTFTRPIGKINLIGHAWAFG